MKKISKGKLLMTIGVVCILAAGALVVHNRMEDDAAGQEADSALESLVTQIPEGLDLSQESGEMPATTVNGRSYIGVISIPVLGIQLPVQQEWSRENARISPCRYKGSAYDNDLIICAHNYRRHFGMLDQLVSGDEIIVTDTNGKSFYYEVVSTETLDTYAVDEMEAGDWDLTVFTCTIGGRSRVTVRCEATGKVTTDFGTDASSWGFTNWK